MYLENQKNKFIDITGLTELISLSNIKHQLIDIDDSEDDYLVQLLNVAFDYVEGVVNSDIIFTHNKTNVYNFHGNIIRIIEGRMLNIDSIIIDGDTVTNYKLKKNRNYFDIYFENTFEDVEIIINYYTGFENDKIPLTLKQAVLMKINSLYDVERKEKSEITGNYVPIGQDDNIRNLLKRYILNYW